jgi:hypothetical protein
MLGSGQLEKAGQVKIKVKTSLIIFSGIEGIVRKEFLFAGQTVNSAYYCEVLLRLCENVRRLRPELWRQKNWMLHLDNTPSHTSFFTSDFLTIVVPRTTYFFLFP